MAAQLSAPEYWARACEELSARDEVLGRLIARNPTTCLQGRGDAFESLSRAIIGQQISVKAAKTIWERFVAAAGDATPDRVRRMREATLRRAGLSERKVQYLKDLASRFAKGEVDPARWASMSDEAVIDELVAVRGVGRWTAEMVLIFNLRRPDVFPADDLGIQTALGRVYGDGERFTRAQAIGLATRWSPWKTVASWYLWRSLDSAEPENE
jgi:DNA-3-methyladenine glycosylase II